MVVAVGAVLAAQAPRFYPDDPLANEPRPLAVNEPQRRALSALLETVSSNLRTRGQRHPADGVLESKGVNTLGEVMDGDWYVNRHAARRMTLAELQRGPGHERPPDLTGDWRVLVVKPFGVNPGLLVADARRDLFILRFDPIGSEGLATGAQMVASQFFYALGYHVGEWITCWVANLHSQAANLVVRLGFGWIENDYRLDDPTSRELGDGSTRPVVGAFGKCDSSNPGRRPRLHAGEKAHCDAVLARRASAVAG